MALRKMLNAPSRSSLDIAERTFHDPAVGRNLTFERTASTSTMFSVRERQSSLAINEVFTVGDSLQNLADQIGELAAPLLAAIKEDQRNKAQGPLLAKVESPPMYVPEVPHLLPISRWCRENETLKDILVAPEAESLPKARLSWYHPDDTMVPRDWFKEGLLDDFEYYFSSKSKQMSPITLKPNMH
mmetsp:Transcript_11936/g.16178  ORF Transcript_11936/g.16178 Transcript_11936/m.16178 type:complete len:186 (+) Transcript_11936:109-666(+)|eukprot:CAMPEP_0196573680 /NCGR_PEP_ID=MMETSP1081-20130531/3540_1 /TAXON_ID=36882 /ORGANISM="Pyramimonas amylifera, Strain CCMP720" /LENGTH=185 /DNA_ID=CAMNT_0041891477 /DNA_START=107 /DNA_END=664 /DNA_ORIENTATION=-